MIGHLNNGTRYIIEHNKNTNFITIAIIVKVGSRYETDDFRGISHFIEHLFFRGTKDYANSFDITNKLYNLGAMVNAFTDKDNTTYWIKINKKYIKEAIKILSKIFFESSFKSSNIKLEKKIVINELETKLSNPFVLLDHLINRLLYRGSNLANPTAGNIGDIAKFDRSMIVSFINKYYVPENMVISIYGNIEKMDDMIEYLEKYFGKKQVHYKSTKEIFIQEPNICFNYCQRELQVKNIVEDLYAQAFISIGTITFPMEDKRVYIVDFIGTLLAGNMSSRLFKKLRLKEGLIYGIKQTQNRYKDTGALKIYLSTFNDQEKIKRCIQIILDEFDKMKKKKITNEEMENTRNYLIGQALLNKENWRSVVLNNGYNLLFEDRIISFDDMVETYKKITRKDILNISREIFNENKLNIAIVSKSKVH